ncbi:bestrophin family ion channel [Variovorax sp. J2P1-59]|uniref:bestrophin family protein n=1 Tax=Variovorax flavidus TaxID=3053501 RepID=UPI002576B7C5|nr:bestrophin family ion channel [Variovorax sp. J2P1-59]MDM0074763.1 bestrophin family ion channel [Variovorax sp. J2P1-59]
MHLGKTYKVSEFLVWTRRQIYLLVVVGFVPVILYQVLGLRWLTIPLTVVGLLGTATSFIVGFKNVQTYNRTVDAQQVWTAILSSSRYWGISIRGFVATATDARDLVERHAAWLTCLRYELRQPKVWESMEKASNVEYRRAYRIPERETSIDEELCKHLSEEEHRQILNVGNRATQVLWLQGRALRRLLDEDAISLTSYIELNKILKEFIEQQGRVERIKNFPYPRQYAIINTIFVWAFCVLLPFGLLKEFDRLNEGIAGFMQGSMVWLVIPFSATISWMYTALEQVGESTENPFEGGANDVPITQIAKTIERELKEIIGDPDLPTLPEPLNDIIL